MAALRKRRFFSFTELNEAISEELDKLNAKPFQKKDDSRLVEFIRVEKPLLTPLPIMPFELFELKKAKVGPNYHVQVHDGCFYSVPYRLIGHTLDIRMTSRLIEIFDGEKRVCSHPRLYGRKGQYSTIEEHMPRGHREYLKDWTPERFINWASNIGPDTVVAIKSILAAKKIVEQSYRSCLGVMSLAKREGGNKRLEAACLRSLQLTSQPSYTLIKRVWADWEKSPTDDTPPSLGNKGHVRGADYFDKDGE